MVLRKKISILFFFILPLGIIWSQSERDSLDLLDSAQFYQEDSTVVLLNQVTLLKKIKFHSSIDRRYYYWYRKKTLKAYPFAQLAAKRLEVLNSRLDSIKSKKAKKKYVKVIQRYMEGEFTDQLKKLTRTEGEILIKLIHRQTGITAYDLIKDFRSGWKAFWYQRTAKIFKLSLKLEYKPETYKKDFLIEDILQRAFIDGILEEQPSKLDFNYHNIKADWLGKTKEIVKGKK